MTLEEIRKNIDRIDLQIKTLFLERMDVANDVAKSKNDAGSSDIYRPDREKHILETLTADVDPAKVPQYKAVIRKIIEVSRWYEYGLLCDWNPSYTEDLVKDIPMASDHTRVKFVLTRADECNSMSVMLSMIGDYGYNTEQMLLLSTDEANKKVTFEITIRGNLMEEKMQKLMFQLYKESENFRILASY